MADDYTGFKTAVSSFLTKVPVDKGIINQNEELARLVRQLTFLLRAEMAAQGITI